MIHRSKKMKPTAQLIYTLVIGLAVVSFWRGAWGIMDIYLLPDNYEMSSWLSIIISLVILYITHHWTKELA
jgi:hypothetical protein